MTSPPTCSGIRVAKALSISRSVHALRTLSSSPSVRAATCRPVESEKVQKTLDEAFAKFKADYDPVELTSRSSDAVGERSNAAGVI
jgi:hypothetical protein